MAAFAVPPSFTSSLPTRHSRLCPRRPRPRLGSRRRPRSHPALVRCLTSPGAKPRPFADSPEPVADYADEFGDWSSEFTTLCQEQLSLICATVVGVASATVFFRREHASGDLEFVPLATHPHDQRVWISSGAASTSYSAPRNLVLPGGIPAEWILPEYPFLNAESQLGIIGDDGSLCVPIMFSRIVAGTLCLRRHDVDTAEARWSEDDMARARMVTRTIALAARMEGRWVAALQQTAQDAELLLSLGDLMRSTMHQVRSPVTALITFGQMLMQKLPPGHKMRAVAKSIVVEGFRLDELLTPLDVAGERLSLPASSAAAPGLAHSLGSAAAPFGGLTEESEALPRELLWVSDILPAAVDSARILAEENGLNFFATFDDDAPPVLGHEHSVREIVHNCLDNALKYTPKGGAVGVYSGVADGDEKTVEIVVWDTGPGIAAHEQGSVWEKGARGSAGLKQGESSGSGLGLAIARDLASRQGGRLSMESPVDSKLLERLCVDVGKVHTGHGTLLRFVLPRAGQ